MGDHGADTQRTTRNQLDPAPGIGRTGYPHCRVHVVDDDDSFRTGLTRVLNASGLRAVGYRCAGEFLLADADDTPGCIVLDVCMPGPTGLELLDQLATDQDSLPVILVSGFGDIPTSVHGMKSGAVDFLVKPIPTDVLLRSVHKAIQHDVERRATRQEIEDLLDRYSNLTTREQAVFCGIVTGKLNKQLAVELGSCERTVKTQRARMMTKMCMSSLAELVRAATLIGIEVSPSTD
jgi:FixJ family two-component response regulator